MLVGDLNIAPLEHDVWSHKQLLKVVSHTPVETRSFEAMRKAGEWVDLMRHVVPADQKIYTWWSYRASRLGTFRPRPPARPCLVIGEHGRRPSNIEMLRAARGWDRPSDHVPVIARFGWSDVASE